MTTGHPDGLNFDHDFWFQCDCGKRVRVAAATYDLQCQGNAPYPRCQCGSEIDIAQAHPAVRDPADIDFIDNVVGQHVWYHSSTFQDWPSRTYRDDTAKMIAKHR